MNWRTAAPPLAKPLQPLSVALKRADLPKTIGKAFKKLLVERVSSRTERVVNPLPFFSSFDKLRLSKISKVSRGGRLRDLKDGYDVAYAHLPRAQEMQNPKPRLVRERPKLRICSILCRTWHTK